MVNTLSIVFMAISLLICFLLPISLTIYFYRKYKISLIAVLLGAIVFLVSQVAIRIPLLAIFGKQQWYIEMTANIYVLALFLALTAGIFEEVGRYIVMKLLMKKSLSFKNGIAFGIGHGGIEAIIIVGLTLLNYIVISAMINSGLFDNAIAATLPPEIAAKIKSTLIDTPTINFLAGGFERTMTMIIQIAFSILVLYSVKFKKPIYLLYAILLHAVVDAPTVVLVDMGLNVWVIEIFVAACAAVGLIYIIKSKSKFAKTEEVQAEE
ncbi:MAG: hypothetical protein K0S75_2231 [Clostridia bacterium]|nr:hypothetical protein [Clostridia bacterium]